MSNEQFYHVQNNSALPVESKLIYKSDMIQNTCNSSLVSSQRGMRQYFHCRPPLLTKHQGLSFHVGFRQKFSCEDNSRFKKYNSNGWFLLKSETTLKYDNPTCSESHLRQGSLSSVTFVVPTYALTDSVFRHSGYTGTVDETHISRQKCFEKENPNVIIKKRAFCSSKNGYGKNQQVNSYRINIQVYDQTPFVGQ